MNKHTLVHIILGLTAVSFMITSMIMMGETEIIRNQLICGLGSFAFFWLFICLLMSWANQEESVGTLCLAHPWLMRVIGFHLCVFGASSPFYIIEKGNAFLITSYLVILGIVFFMRGITFILFSMKSVSDYVDRHKDHVT